MTAVAGVPIVSVFMPCYRVAGQLKEALCAIPPEALARIHSIHVLDDGSDDGSADVARSLAGVVPHLVVHAFPENRGYGTMVREGVRLCLNDGVPWVACLHGDGQYDPRKLTSLLDEGIQGGHAIVQGSRHKSGKALQGGMPAYKWIAGKVLVALENLVFRRRMSDYHSGYLLYQADFLQTIGWDAYSRSFDMDLELIATAVAQGRSVGEVAIPTRYAGEETHLHPVRYGLRVLRVLWRFLRGCYG